MSPTPGNTNGVVAQQAVTKYIGDLVAGRYSKAWKLLSTQSQQHWGDVTAFTAERAAFMASAGARFTLSDPDNSAAALDQWLPADFDGEPADAFVVTVTYRALAGSNAGREVYVAAPDTDSAWRVWVAR